MMIRTNLLHPLMTDLYHVPNRVTHTFQRGAKGNNLMFVEEEWKY